MYPEVSVIMPVYNGEMYLSEAIKSILNQSFTDYEFIIVNDGSEDSTATILNQWREQDKRIRIIDQERQGVAKSLNQAIAHSSGKYIARMDADDICLKDRLGKQVQYLKKHPRTAVVGSAVTYMDHSGRIHKFMSMPARSPHHVKRELKRGRNPFAHPTTTIVKRYLEEVGGYRSKYEAVEDYDLWLRLAERYDLVNLKEVLLMLRIHKGGVTSARIKDQAAMIYEAMSETCSPDDAISHEQSGSKLQQDDSIKMIAEDKRRILLQIYIWRAMSMHRVGEIAMCRTLVGMAEAVMTDEDKKRDFYATYIALKFKLRGSKNYSKIVVSLFDGDKGNPLININVIVALTRYAVQGFRQRFALLRQKFNYSISSNAPLGGVRSA